VESDSTFLLLIHLHFLCLDTKKTKQKKNQGCKKLEFIKSIPTAKNISYGLNPKSFFNASGIDFRNFLDACLILFY